MRDLELTARYMGARLDESTLPLLLAAKEKASLIANPRHVLKAVKLAHQQNGVLADGLLLEGESIKRHLSGLKQGYLIAATLGIQMDEAIRRESILSIAGGLSLSAYASVMIEDYLDTLQESLNPVTSRFSPGYGDLPLSLQPAFLNFVNAKSIGLYMTEGLMMVPEKSVTAILGKTDKATGMTKCTDCTSTNCPYKEEAK